MWYDFARHHRQDLKTMPPTRKRSFTLPFQQAESIDAKVASGAYASARDVARAGLLALQERDAAMERWLVDEVAPVYDAMKADPSRAIPADHRKPAHGKRSMDDHEDSADVAVDLISKLALPAGVEDVELELPPMRDRSVGGRRS
jgi:antitoxin ParD1/3/4